MKALPYVLKACDEEVENSDTHEYGPAADEYGMINVRAEQFRRVKLEEYTESRIVRVETTGRGWKYQLEDHDYYKATSRGTRLRHLPPPWLNTQWKPQS